MSKVGNKIDQAKLQPGDLVFFNTRKHAFSHVGIYIGEERFVHAPSRGREVEVADMHDRYWKKRYNGARRVSF
jgi:cell wall-associated NlpC family hydrolase